MKIEKIYCYPVKALLAVELNEAELTKNGFAHDRRFMLLAVEKDKEGKTIHKNVHIGHYPSSVLFQPSIDVEASSMTITYKPTPGQGEEKSLEIPLEPYTGDLEKIEITMHKSATQAYKMAQQYSDWFSSCYGFEVILVYLGPHYRPLRMSSTADNNNNNNNNNNNTSNNGSSNNGSSWLSSLTSTATSYLPSLSTTANEKEILTFNDCAPYLICSSKSMEDVLTRLPQPEQQDFSILRFRPNIIISDASEPWDEDFWSQLTITNPSNENEKTKIDCIHNCGRCKSINIDYTTGAPGTTEAGQMLKKLQKDRRVDPGAKYSPIFGRYSFVNKDSEGHVIRVGDEVEVSKRNSERTRFDWEGLATS